MFVWKKLCGRRCRSIPLTRIRSVSGCGQQDLAVALEHRLVLGQQVDRDTTRAAAGRPAAHGRCLRIRATGSCERSTNRSISSPSGDWVTSRYFSSPRAPRTSYGVRPARVTKSASTGQCRPDAGRVQAAAAQVHAVAVRVEDAERRLARPCRRRPSSPCCGTRPAGSATGGSHRSPGWPASSVLALALLARQLQGVGLLDQGAGPASSGLVVGAVHRGPRLPSPRPRRPARGHSSQRRVTNVLPVLPTCLPVIVPLMPSKAPVPELMVPLNRGSTR